MSSDATSTLWNSLSESPRAAILATIARIIFVRSFTAVFYRLLLSPLAKFPGPKLAAVTGLYEFYFNFFKNGKFVFEIERLHNIYGMHTFQDEHMTIESIDTNRAYPPG